jgi:hypothetical protein
MMAEGFTTSEILPRPPSEAEANAERIIAERGDARAVVIELLTLVDALKCDNKRLAKAVSRGFSRTEFLSWP